MSNLEIVVEKLDLHKLFGNSVGLPREVCQKIEDFIDYIRQHYETFVSVTEFKCAFCISYAPVKLLRTSGAIKNQANKMNPRKPRISHVLLMNGTLYELLDCLERLMNIINHPPAKPRDPAMMTASEYYWHTFLAAY